MLAMKAGLDPEKVVAAPGGGAAGSWILANRSGRMIANEYPLGFRIALHRKDLGNALELARETGAALPVASLAAQIENGLIAQGHGDDDNAALARAIRDWSGIQEGAALRAAYGSLIPRQGPQVPRMSFARTSTDTCDDWPAPIRTSVAFGPRGSRCHGPRPTRDRNWYAATPLRSVAW